MSDPLEAECRRWLATVNTDRFLSEYAASLAAFVREKVQEETKRCYEIAIAHRTARPAPGYESAVAIASAIRSGKGG